VATPRQAQTRGTGRTGGHRHPSPQRINPAQPRVRGGGEYRYATSPPRSAPTPTLASPTLATPTRVPAVRGHPYVIPTPRTELTQPGAQPTLGYQYVIPTPSAYPTQPGGQTVYQSTQRPWVNATTNAATTGPESQR
jgi:hypothetical protein